jgi:ABC-type amino acid transport substrate-binding protein
MEQRPGVRLAKYNTIDLALLDLQNGREDAVASDGPVLRYMVRRSFQGLKLAGREYTAEHFGIVLARTSDDLRRAVNAALWRLQDGGEYTKIYSK